MKCAFIPAASGQLPLLMVAPQNHRPEVVGSSDMGDFLGKYVASQTITALGSIAGVIEEWSRNTRLDPVPDVKALSKMSKEEAVALATTKRRIPYTFFLKRGPSCRYLRTG